MKFHFAFRFVVLGLWAAPFVMADKMEGRLDHTADVLD
tara:strand:- start:92 stop:205 length:114 start_codon:yes stop_codon:yes gene_type:complete